VLRRNVRTAVTVALASIWLAGCSTSSATPGTGTCCEFAYGDVTTCSCTLDGGTSACVTDSELGVPITATLVPSCVANPLAPFEPEAGPLPDTCIALSVCCTSGGATGTEGCVSMAQSGNFSSQQCLALVGELVAVGKCLVDASVLP